MSIFTYTITPDASSVILLSDGLATHNGSVHAEDMRKVFRVSDRLSYVWLGSGGPDMLEEIHRDIKEQGLDTPKAVAGHLSEIIEKCLEASAKVRETTPIMAVVFGYDPDLTCLKIWSPDGAHSKALQLQPGDSGGYSYNKDGSALPYPEYLVTRYWPRLKPDLFKSCVGAFDATVKELQADNVPVGGMIFSEVINKPINPKKKTNESRQD